MDPAIYKQILNYKTNGSYPDGYSKTEKANLRKKANSFDLQGKSHIKSNVHNFFYYIINVFFLKWSEI